MSASFTKRMFRPVRTTNGNSMLRLIIYFARKIAPNFSETGFATDLDKLIRANLARATIDTAGAMMIPPATIKTMAN